MAPNAIHSPANGPLPIRIRNASSKGVMFELHGVPLRTNEHYGRLIGQLSRLVNLKNAAMTIEERSRRDFHNAEGPRADLSLEHSAD